MSEGKKPLESLYTAFESLTDTTTPTDPDEFVTDDLEVLYNERIKRPGLRWRLATLNRMLGSLRKGDFGFVFARPETGKTTFLASEVSFFAGQCTNPILWFNNEEEGSKVQLRVYQATLGYTLNELFANLTDNRNRYASQTGNRIKIIDAAAIHRSRVEELCKRLRPDLVIFDQIDKIKGFDADREDLRLGAVYVWARELAKSYCPVIGICQADGTGEGKKWLTMDNVANAKTSKQAEADWILGIGATHQDGYEYVRHLHLSKNKLTGDEDTDPELRHGKADVIIVPQIARYKDFS